jgi:heat shock protein HtpX
MGKTVSYFKTTILLAGLTGLILAISYALGGSNALIIGFVIALVMNLGSYWFSDKIVLKMAGAKELSRSNAPELFEDTAALAKKMKLPMPKLYMSPDVQPNAFATGRDPKHGVVCVTQGLVQGLSREEVRGVIAHELAHIKNYDILISSIAAVLAGAISSVGEIFFWTGLAGGNNDEDRGPLGAVATLVMIIIAPIAAMLIQFAISRTREYAADATAAEYTGNPKALAHALIKIQQIATTYPMQHSAAISSLYIQNPGGLQGIQELFSTHPLTEKRVEKLMNMK